MSPLPDPHHPSLRLGPLGLFLLSLKAVLWRNIEKEEAAFEGWSGAIQGAGTLGSEGCGWGP